MLVYDYFAHSFECAGRVESTLFICVIWLQYVHTSQMTLHAFDKINGWRVEEANTHTSLISQQSSSHTVGLIQLSLVDKS